MPAPARSLTLAPLRVRSFRYQFPADLLTSWAFEMEFLILGWFVMVQTGSVLWLTAFGSVQFVGTLAAPMFGVLGDRLGGRTMLCLMRTGYLVLAVALMGLGLAGALTPVQVFVLSALGGIVRPNDLVMRNALIGDTMPREHLMGALGLSRATVDSARVAGALAGAGLSSALGVGGAYAVVASFYLASLALTFGVSPGRPVPDPVAGVRPAGAAGAISLPRPSNWRELVDGLLHVWTTPRLLAAIWLAFLVNLTAYPTTGGLLPYVARTIYQVDAGGLGWLVAGFSLGPLAGSLAMVLTGGPAHPERAMLLGVIGWYALLLGFGHAQDLAVGLVILVLAGIVQSVAMISLLASLLDAAGERFRGRVMGVRMLAVYGLPVGLMAAGALVDRVGFPATVTVYCLAGLASTALIGLRWRASLWRARVSGRASA